MPWRSKSDCRGEKGNFQSGHQQDSAGRTRRFTSAHLTLLPLGEAGALLHVSQTLSLPQPQEGTRQTLPHLCLPPAMVRAAPASLSPNPRRLPFPGVALLPPSLLPAPPASSRALVPSRGGRALPTPAAAFLPSSRGKASPRPVSAQKQPIPLYLLLQELPPTACSTCTIQTAWSWQLLLHPCFPSETAVLAPLIPPNFQPHTQKAAAALGSPAQPSAPAQVCFDVPSRWQPCAGERVPNSPAQLLPPAPAPARCLRPAAPLLPLPWGDPNPPRCSQHSALPSPAASPPLSH